MAHDDTAGSTTSARSRPGIEWVARRTGRSPEELTASPQAAVGALGDALREALALAALMEADDPQVRAEAQAEAAALRERFARAPRPADRFFIQVAAALRETAERLRPASTKPDDPA